MSPRTEVQIVADTILTLRQANVLARHQMPAAARAVGIQNADLLQALERYQLRGDRPVRPTGTPPPGAPAATPVSAPAAAPTPAPPTPPTPRRGAAPTPPRPIPKPMQRRARREIDGVSHLHCPGCDDWIPEAEFIDRSDKPGVKVSRCSPCRAEYHRERRVTTRVLDAMSQVGVAFTLDEESNIVGVECAKCGRGFAPGDIVHGVTELAHQGACPGA